MQRAPPPASQVHTSSTGKGIHLMHRRRAMPCSAHHPIVQISCDFEDQNVTLIPLVVADAKIGRVLAGFKTLWAPTDPALGTSLSMLTTARWSPQIHPEVCFGVLRHALRAIFFAQSISHRTSLMQPQVSACPNDAVSSRIWEHSIFVPTPEFRTPELRDFVSRRQAADGGAERMDIDPSSPSVAAAVSSDEHPSNRVRPAKADSRHGKFSRRALVD